MIVVRIQNFYDILRQILLGGVTGVWLATPVAELLGAVMAAAAAAKYRGRYGY